MSLSEGIKNSIKKDEAIVAQEVAGEGALDLPVGDWDDEFNRYAVAAQQAKAEYLELHSKLGDTLSVSHLEPFVKVVTEHKLCFQQDQSFIESLKEKLVHDMKKKLNTFWTENNVDNSITTLAMLKQMFKNFEGVDWKAQDKTPTERMAPRDIHIKKKLLANLKKQVEYQKIHLESVSKTNEEHRTRIRDISKKRVILMEAIEHQTKLNEEMRGIMLQMMQDLLRVPSSGDSVEPTDDKAIKSTTVPKQSEDVRSEACFE